MDKETLSASADLLLDEHATEHARGLVRAMLASWGVTDDDAYDALLVVSELVGNATRHSGHVAAHIEVSLDALGLLVAVRDGSAVVPERREVGLLDESGRGYLIIEGLALEWGVGDEPDGKRVWVLLADPRPLPRPVPRHPQCQPVRTGLLTARRGKGPRSRGPTGTRSRRVRH
jgi:anti-sigma regulatory factor (Ser/Thr protein kinase)